MPKRTPRPKLARRPAESDYAALLGRVSELLEQGRRAGVRAVNAVLAATYWQVGRQIVEHEQGGKPKAEYGEVMLKRLGQDLSARFGRGFSWRNLFSMRQFYRGWEICQTAPGRFEARVELPQTDEPGQKLQTLSAISDPTSFLLDAFPLPWSHYVRLMSVKDDFARWFYEDEAVCGGWSVRQLDRQISTQFFERTVLSRDKETMLRKGRDPKPQDAVALEEMVRDPYVLEFLDLKDEYAESELEQAIIDHLQTFLLEMGAGFAFVARQKRIRIGNVWYKMDLVPSTGCCAAW